MKVQKKEGAIERKITIAMIVNQTVLGQVATWWKKGGLFKSRWSNTVGQWSVDYFRKYGKPPGKSIESQFESWANNGHADKDTITLIERFLETISGEYEDLSQDINPDYILDLAEEHFNDVALAKLMEVVEGDRDRGKVADALKKVQSFSKIEVGSSATVNVLQDKESLQAAFEEDVMPLIKFKGALGEFLNEILTRDSFVAFVAPDKTGKSFMLQEVAWQGMLQRKRVALFQVGDLSKNQSIRRLVTRAARRPLKATKKPIKYPTLIVHDPDAKYAEVQYDERDYKDDLSWREAYKTFEEIQRKKVKSKEPLLKLSVHPTATLSVPGMRGILESWENEGWTPDIIVIDYADILAPMLPGAVETRHQINATWEALRALSQSLHCLVVTATQSNAKAYNTDLLTRSNFSEDKRKNAHVTAMLGINVTAEERAMGLSRINKLFVREFPFDPSKCVHLAGCLAIANPAVRSSF